ncbi:hypothetical protein [Streptomyces sp. NPDC002676]
MPKAQLAQATSLATSREGHVEHERLVHLRVFAGRSRGRFPAEVTADFADEFQHDLRAGPAGLAELVNASSTNAGSLGIPEEERHDARN